jgi:ATP/maltotriose-dependent transcriptional regulator MalT
MKRARSLLLGLENTAEYGWLTLWEGHLALMLQNDTQAGRRQGREAAGAARALALTDLEMMGLALEGLSLVSEGQIEAGMSRLDEASTAALAGEISDLGAVSTILCYLIDACDRARDYDRAAQWCERAREIAKSRNFDALFSFCRPHYAVVLMWRGAWQEAEDQLTTAQREIAVVRPPMVGESIIRLAELRWRQGRWDEAATLFAEVEHEGLAQLGRAELALGLGDAETAADLADRFLRRIPADDRMERVGGLELKVRSMIALGRLDSAAEALAELREVAAGVGTEPLLASASLAQGLLAAAQGDWEGARRHLEDAVDLYERQSAPFESGRVRIELARVLAALERWEAAAHEAQAARQSLAAMGAMREAERAAAVLRGLQGGGTAPLSAPNPDGLSPREIEVVCLVAAGRSNQEIADELVLSVRTVERHISTIYEKAGFSGKSARAAVTAYAVRLGLTDRPRA